MIACGVWLGRRGLAAVLVDSGGRVAFTATVARTDAARWALAQRLAAVGADLVIDEAHLPADPVAHAIALDHVLHFFLAEKGVLPPEKLAPHAPRLTALADYANAHTYSAVPRLALFAALHHCQALGLEIPPEAAATAERLSDR